VFLTKTDVFLCEIIAEADIIVLVAEADCVLYLVPAKGEEIIDHRALNVIDFKF
jgi:hypothetical protein